MPQRELQRVRYVTRWQRHSAVTLSDFCAGLVDDDRQVRVSRRPVTEGALQCDLTRGRRQEIGAAHDLGHALRLVVDDDRELIREDSISAVDHEVARCDGDVFFDLPGDEIFEGNDA